MPLSALKNIFVALALTALLPISSFGQSTCIPCNETSANFDRASGLCLPSAIDGFETARFPDPQIEAMKAYRNTVIAGYNNATNRLAITIYLYDRDPTAVDGDLKEIRSVVAEILSAHKGGKMEMGGKSSLPLTGQVAETEGGLFTWREGSNDYASFLWLIPRDKRYVKFRATYVRPNGGETEAMANALASVKKIAAEICTSR
jgi:hypothetical protein